MYILIDFRGEYRKSRGYFARCGERPGYAPGLRRASGPDPIFGCGRDSL